MRYNIFINVERGTQAPKRNNSDIRLTIVSRLNHLGRDPIGFMNYAILPTRLDDAYELGVLCVANHFLFAKRSDSVAPEEHVTPSGNLEAFITGATCYANQVTQANIEVIEVSEDRQMRFY